MLLVEAYARERSMGEYRRVVAQIRKAIGELSPKQMARYFDIKESDCTAAIDRIEKHPDWDNEQIAEDIDWDE